MEIRAIARMSMSLQCFADVFEKVLDASDSGVLEYVNSEKYYELKFQSTAAAASSYPIGWVGCFSRVEVS